MLILRCTRKLLPKGLAISGPAPTPTAPLGEWYANRVPVPFRGRGLVMYTNAATLLTVVAPGRELHTTLPVFRQRLPALLGRLHLPAPWVERHRAAADEVWTGPTTDRRVLGSMNDFANGIWWQAEAHRSWADVDLDAIELRLAQTPMSMLGEGKGLGFPCDILAALVFATPG